MHKAAGDFKDEDTQMTGANVQRLVTADGTYATQSAFSTNVPAKKDEDRYGEDNTAVQHHILNIFLLHIVYKLEFYVLDHHLGSI